MRDARGKLVALRRLSGALRVQREAASNAFGEAGRVHAARAQELQSARARLDESMDLWQSSVELGPIDPYMLGVVADLIADRRGEVAVAASQADRALDAANEARSILAHADARVEHTQRIAHRAARVAGRRSEEARYRELELIATLRSAAAE